MVVIGFAAAVDPRLAEARSECLREIQWALTEWERHRRDEDKGALKAMLRQLAFLVDVEPDGL